MFYCFDDEKNNDKLFSSFDDRCHCIGRLFIAKEQN